MKNAGVAREVGCGIPVADICRHVVAGKTGPEIGLREAGNLIRANAGAAYRIEGVAFRENERKGMIMSLRSWLFGATSEKFDRAMILADEVTRLMRERDVQRDPFKPILADLLFQTHDPALVADAYEISQESRIYKAAFAGGRRTNQ